MTSGPEQNRPDGPDNTVNDFDQLEKQLGQGLGEDPRLESGVPQDQRGSDIEFIQMSGLVRPSAPPSPALPPAPDDLDASRPVSFFEKGVADVDADMAPGPADGVVDADILSVQQTRSAMSHLRDIIDDLTKDVPAATTDPSLLAALDAPEAKAEAAPQVESTPAAEPAPPVTLDDILAEMGPAHPMQEEAPDEHGQAQSNTVVESPRVDRPEPDEHGQTQTNAVAAPPRLTRPAPILPAQGAQLAEAERLLDELELASESEAPIAAALRNTAADELPDEALDFKKQGKRRHRSTSKNPVRDAFARLAAMLLVVSALAAAAYAGYLWIQQRMVSPDQLFNQASRLVTKGEYAAGAQMFEQFASLHPEDPMRAEAQFNAAFALQLQKPSGNDEAQDAMKQALRLFEQFRTENPTHPKVARAQTIMGRLNYESGRFAEAVELLRDPELRLRDPASAVPALRTLARASAKMGDAESARSYYLQAVGVQGNHSPDVDYAELGSLYQSSADRTEDLDKRIELQQLAIESWAHALEVPGIDPSSKQTIRSQLDVLRERLQAEPGMAPAMESLGGAETEMDAAAPATDANDSPAPEASAAEPAAPSGEPAPAAEHKESHS